MQRSFLFSIIFVFVVACCSVGAGLVKENYNQHTLYVYNFTRYIQWANVNNELVIGISGGNTAIMEAFEKMAQAKSTPDLALKVRKVLLPGDVATCHLLYIPAAESSKAAIYAARAERNQLIITEGPDMLQQGGMINFVEVDKKLRFEMNQEKLEQAGLKVSSTLTVMAVQVP